MKIDIRDNIPDDIAIELVGIVIRQGRISKHKGKDYYCWATQITYRDEDYTIYVRDNRIRIAKIILKCLIFMPI